MEDQPIDSRKTIDTFLGPIPITDDLGMEMVAFGDMRYRVQMWPCLSTEEPEVAMGLFTLLSYLAGQTWTETVVYNVFIKKIEQPENYTWSIRDSQFSMADPIQASLSKARKIAGHLSRNASGWNLQVVLVDELADAGNNHFSFHYTAQTLHDLLLLLPRIVNNLAIKLAFRSRVETVFTLDPLADDYIITGLLKRLFGWQRMALLGYKGIVSPEADFNEAFEALMTSCKLVKGELGAWSISIALARALQCYFDYIDWIVLEFVPAIFSAFPDSESPVFQLGRGLYQLAVNYHDNVIFKDVCRLLENQTQRHPRWRVTWQVLAEIYWAVGRVDDSLRVCQYLIQEDLANEHIYLTYAKWLLDSAYEKRRLSGDGPRWPSKEVVWQAIETYQTVLDKSPDHIDALDAQLKAYAFYNLADNRFWKHFEHLVEIDHIGQVVRNLIEDFYNLDDVSPALDILQRWVARQPDRYDLHLNFGALLLLDGDRYNAQTYLIKAQHLPHDRQARKDISRLTLLALKPPDFETQLIDIEEHVTTHITISDEPITCIVHKWDHPIKETDIQFVEDIIEIVPDYIDMYITLAYFYWALDEPENALEVLLDAHKRDSGDPGVIYVLAALLWTMGENNLALDYLKQGLKKAPNTIALLALGARFYYEIGQDERAQDFLRQAEKLLAYGIEYHVGQVRKYIANKQK